MGSKLLTQALAYRQAQHLYLIKTTKVEICHSTRSGIRLQTLAIFSIYVFRFLRLNYLVIYIPVLYSLATILYFSQFRVSSVVPTPCIYNEVFHTHLPRYYHQGAHSSISLQGRFINLWHPGRISNNCFLGSSNVRVFCLLFPRYRTQLNQTQFTPLSRQEIIQHPSYRLQESHPIISSHGWKYAS